MLALLKAAYGFITALKRLSASKHVLNGFKMTKQHQIIHESQDLSGNAAEAIRNGTYGVHGHKLFEEDYFSNDHGLWIFTRTWMPSVAPKALILLVHGFGEHCGRYEMVAQTLVNRGFAVSALDHQGHGRSEGDRAYAEQFQHLVDDVLHMAQRAVSRCSPDTPVFFLGHSMGGLITVHAAVQAVKNKSLKLHGVVLSGPALQPDPNVATPLKVFLVKLLSKQFPKLVFDALPGYFVSRDAQVVQHYMNDPLVYTGGVKARMAHGLLAAMQTVEGLAPDIKWPFLLLQGKEDRLVLPEGATAFYTAAGTEPQHKRLEMLEGLFHEIFNEPEGPELVGKVCDWVERYVDIGTRAWA